MSLLGDGPFVDSRMLRMSDARDPEFGPWIRALAMSMLIRRAEGYIGMKMHRGQVNHIEEALRHECELMRRDNRIFEVLPRLLINVEGTSIGLQWEGYPGASLPVPTHSLLWEFLGTRPKTTKTQRWEHAAARDVVATIQDMEQDADGRALLVDFDTWLERRTPTRAGSGR